MTEPTWGLRIVGYSSPSVAQERAFKRKYPALAARHAQERHERDDARELRRRARVPNHERAYYTDWKNP